MPKQRSRNFLSAVLSHLGLTAETRLS